MNQLAPVPPRSNVMLVRLAVVYGKPDSDDPQAFVAEYARMMHQYVDSEMEEAADRLLASHKYKRWPSIAECLEALEAVRTGKRARLLAAQMLQREAQKILPKASPAEQREAEQFVDDTAAGKVDLGFCASMLRGIAKTMQGRRGRS